ncbi:MAG: hypothetical protein AAF604_20125 [Acidobacteriota bacterium]
MSWWWTGFVAGVAHAAQGPDHLAAVAPLAAARGRRGAALGAVWGAGHGVGVVFLGLLAWLLNATLAIAFDVAVLSRWAEALVGVLLIVMGVLAAWRTRRPAGSVAAASMGRGLLAAFAVGWVHGVAGLAHLWVVLPSVAGSQRQALGYLATYLVGAIVAMAVFGWLVGRLGGRGGERTLRRVLLVTAIAAIAVGVYWLAASFGFEIF